MKLLVAILFSATAALGEAPPREWVDPATGHRVVRLSDQNGTASLYFHQNSYTASGDKMVVTTRAGLSTIDLETRKIQPLVQGRVSNAVVGKRTRQVFYMKNGTVYATHLDTGATRAIVERRELSSGSGFALNADETMLAGSFAGDGGGPRSVAAPGNGQWIYLFKPEDGALKAEKLVNLASHDYDFEPNVIFTPNQKWIVFRSNIYGETHVYAVEVQKNSRALALTHVNVVNVVDGRITANSTVTITDQTINSVAPNGVPPAGATVVDGRNGYLIPGLWDMHAHMEASGPSWLQLYVANGVTGIRDMGSELDLILKMRADVSSGRVLGPRIFAAGPILDDAPGDWPYRMRVKTAEDGRAAVQLLKRRGVDLIKVHDHTPREAFFAIADEARRQNLPLAGHRPLQVKLEEMIDAGQRDLEHLDNQQLWKPCRGQGYQPGMCRELFEMLARRGVWQTPTLVAMSELASIGTPASSISEDHLAYAPKSLRNMWAGNQSLFARPEVVRSMKADAEVGAAVTAGMAKAGVGILAGCDTMIAGFCVHDELAAMVRGGMTPLAALQTATLNPARYFNIQQTSGSVAPGRRADLVLLEDNPLTNIANVSRIRAVVLAGRLLDRKELDRLLADAKAAARR